MGWSYGPMPPRGQSMKDYYQGRWGIGQRKRTLLNGEVTFARGLLDLAVVRLTTGYGAYVNSDGVVLAVVILMKWVPKAEWPFGEKDIDETMGPNEAACPRRILDLLDPPLNDSAARWRERCEAYHAERAKYPPLAQGDTLLFPEPVAFRGGAQIRELTYQSRRGSRYIFTSPHHHGRYILTDWKRYEPTVRKASA